jgi:RecB family exonuclease
MPSLQHSWTSIRAYQQCPKKAAFLYRGGSGESGAPDIVPAQAGIGTVVHRAIAEILHDLGFPSGREAIEAWLDERDQGDLPGLERVTPEDRDNVDLSTRRILRKWGLICRERFGGHEPLRIEASFSVTFQASEVTGVVDAVSRAPDGNVWVIDWKTGGFKPEYRTQVGLYALWVRRETLLGAGNPRGCIVDVKTGNAKSMVVDEGQANRLEKRIGTLCRRLEERLKENEFQAQPSAACRYCTYLQQCEEGTRHVDVAGI